MPYKRRTPKKKRNRGYTTAHIEQFRHGFDFGGNYGRPKAFGDICNNESARTAYAEAWEIFREQVLLDWIRSEPRPGDHGGPGTRPYAWWFLDAPERRRRIDGKPHPFDNPERDRHIREKCGAWFDSRALFYGCPQHLCVRDDFEAVYETEAAYIDRLGLWLPREQELLAELRAREPEPKQQRCESWSDDDE